MLGLDTANGAALLWMQLLLVWALASYLPYDDPSGHQELELLREKRLLPRWKRKVLGRGVAAAVIAALLPGFDSARALPRAALAVLMLAGTILLPLVRVRLADATHRRQDGYEARALRVQRGVWLAEWELGMNALMAATAWWIVNRWDLSIGSAIVTLPLHGDRLARITGCTAVTIIIVSGGAFVVRGILNKVGALPLQERRPEERIDLVEFSRGRIIGILERFIVLLLMAVQAYQAIAFLMAAKGLIRSRDLESRDFAEYFLIGTLASTGLALLGGIAIQLLLNP